MQTARPEVFSCRFWMPTTAMAVLQKQGRWFQTSVPSETRKTELAIPIRRKTICRWLQETLTVTESMKSPSIFRIAPHLASRSINTSKKPEQATPHIRMWRATGQSPGTMTSPRWVRGKIMYPTWYPCWRETSTRTALRTLLSHTATSMGLTTTIPAVPPFFSVGRRTC